MRPGFILTIATLNLWRSWRTTLVLSFMVVSAVASLVFLASLAIGTTDAMIRNSIGLFSGHISATGLPGGMKGDLLTGKGIARVLIRTQHNFLLWKDDAFAPVLLVGVDPKPEKETTAIWQKTVAGRYLLPDEDSLYLSQETAKTLKVSIGGQVQVGSHPGASLQTLTVVGLFKTGISHFDQGLAFCPGEAFPPAVSMTTAAVFVEDGADIEATVEHYRKLVPGGTFSAWTEFMPDLKQLIDLNLICMGILMVLVFGIVSVGISCAFLIFTLKNLREHGIMKAMGIMPLDTALLLVSQIGILTCSAAALGTVVGMATVALFSHTGIDLTSFTSHNQYFSVSGIIYPRLTTAALLAPPLLAIGFGLAAAIWPSLYIIRKSPADIIRSV
jgi:ABC-type lipoprotein release transport system permease subunit